MVGLAPHKRPVSVDVVVGLETHGHCAAKVCAGYVGVGKDLKALSQTLQMSTLSLSCPLSPHTDPIQKRKKKTYILSQTRP